MKHTLAIALTCFGAWVAFGDIQLWSGNPNDVTLTVDSATINAPGTFKFQAEDVSENLDAIGSITVADGVTGTVIVYIERDTDDDSPGATNVGAIDLTNNQGASLTGNLAELRITGDLATANDVVCDNITGTVVCGDVDNDITLTGALTGNMTVSDISGNIAIGGNLGQNGPPATTFTAGDVTGSITISGYLWDDVTVNTMADFTVEDSGSDTVTGDIAIAQGYSGTMIIWDALSGNITVGGEMSGLIDMNRNMVNGSITIGTDETNANLTGEIEVRAGATIVVNGNVSSGGLIDGRTWLSKPVQVTGNLSGGIAVVGAISPNGSITIGGNVTSTGSIDIGGDLDKPGRIDIVGAVSQTDATTPAIHIHGWLDGAEGEDPEDPMIEVGGELGGVIAINGGLDNAINGPEIHVGSIDTENLGAIAIDYNGWHDAHDWDGDAVIKVNTTEYTENTPLARVYRISKCRGDLDNDRGLDSVDQAAMDLSAAQYAADYPGLLESHYHHGDVDDDHDVDEFDAAALDWLIGEGCVYCMTGGELEACNADIVEDGTVNLADLAQLLAHYGMTSGATRNDGDVQGNDGDVDLADLAELLSYYGDLCGCFDAAGGGGGDGPSYVDVSVVAYDTKGYSGGGFEGEVDHFVFDLKIEVLDPNNDDWVVTGAALRTYNDAAFRLSTSETTPDQYATFVAAPWTSVPGSATANLAGAYDPPNPSGKFITTGINLGWYDTAESHDGPATVMRIVIDVSEVEGADVSEGFGSVYFGNKIGEDDILVGDLASGTYTAESAPDAESLSGSFWVKGE